MRRSCWHNPKLHTRCDHSLGIQALGFRADMDGRTSGFETPRQPVKQVLYALLARVYVKGLGERSGVRI